MRTILFISLFICSLYAIAQEKEPFGVEDKFTFDTDKPFKLLELDNADSEPIAKKKRRKRKVFYGIKTRKKRVVKFVRDKKIFEIFYILKKPEKPNPFIRDIYWYSFERKSIQKSKSFDPAKGVLLHGPYKKTLDGLIVEEGIFFKGTKHGRWMTHDNNDILVDKKKYYKGYPKESIITYYDPTQRTKVKEIIPIENTEREGYYCRYHENGNIAVTGEYQWDERVGEWVENYPNGKIKKIISYSSNPYDKKNLPFVKREWTDKGKVVFFSNQKQNN